MNGDTPSIFGNINALIESGSRLIGKPLGAGFGEVAGGFMENVAPKYAETARRVGTQVGEGFPRFLAEAMLYGAKRTPLKALGLADVALRSSQQPGADIGSTLAHTAAFASAPSFGGRAERMVEPLAQRAASRFTSPGGRMLASEAVKRPASVAGSLVPFEAADALQAYRTGQPYQPFSPENIIGTAASVLPFEAARIPGIAREYRKLVNEVPVNDQAEVWRVHYNVHDEDKQRDFNDKQMAFDFADELRKTARIEPRVESAGVVPRSYVTHQMAFKPEDLVSEPFGLSTSELLRDMPQVKMPGSQLAGMIRNKVPPIEWKTLNEAGLGEFLKQPRLPEEVAQWLQQNKPVQVETKFFQGGETQSAETHRYNQEIIGLRHQLETFGYDLDIEHGLTRVKIPGASDIVPVGEGISDNEHLPKEHRDVASKLSRLEALVEGRIPSFEGLDPDDFRQISSSGTSPQKMVVVRVPAKTLEQAEKEKPNTLFLGERSADTTRGILHRGPHLGTEDVNVLGWSRGHDQVVNLKGKNYNAFVGDEVQSDWGQSRREQEEKFREHLKSGRAQDTPASRAGYFSVAEHPLLKDWPRLVLKAQIAQSIKEGKDAIVLPDAETAMMSEGHDVDYYRWNIRLPNGKLANEGTYSGYASRETAEKVAKQVGGTVVETEPPQAGGMRLNYDTILPKIMEELTGVKGEKVDLGEHQKAFRPYEAGQRESLEATGPNMTYPRSNLIFRNPDGSLKTHASGLLYDLSKIKPELAKRGGFPMFGSEKFVKSHIERMMAEGYSPEEAVRAMQNVRMLQPIKGETPLQTLARSVGMDPKLFASLPPGEALPRALEFLASMFHYNYGQSPDRAAYLARQVALPLARFAPFLGKTRFALAPFADFASRFYGVKEPKSDLFKYLISVAEKDVAFKSQQGLTFDIAFTLAHEATHNAVAEAMNPIGDPARARPIIRALANVEAIPPNLRKDVMLQALRLVVPQSRWAEFDKINFENHKDHPEEFLADFAAVLSVGSTKAESVKNLKDAMFFGDRASQQFSQAIYRDLTAAWSGAKDWLNLTGVSSHEGKKIASLVDGIYKNLTSIMQSVDEAERTLDGFQGFMERLQATPLDPPPVVSADQMHAMFSQLDNLEKQAHPRYVTAAQELTNEAISQIRPYEKTKVAGERMGFWRDFFKPMSQLVESMKEKVPSAIPVKALGFQYRSQVSEMQNLTWQVWADENGKVDWRRLRWLGKDDSPQERAFSSIALIENVRTQKDDAQEMLTREQREKLSPEYKALSTEDKDKVDLSLENSAAMTRMLARYRWAAHRDRVAWEMSKIIMSYNKTLYHDKAKSMADEAVKWFFDTPKDIERFQDWFNGREAFLASLPLPDKGKQALEEAVRANIEPYFKLGDALLGKEDFNGERRGKTFYLPEVRVREWHIAWRMQGEDLPHHEAFKTDKQAAKKLAEIKAMPGLDWVKSFNRKDRTDRFRGAVQEEITSAQQDALDALKASVLSRISNEHPEAQEIIARINEEFQPATAFQQVTVSPYMREREFIPGRENLNMVEGLVRYIDASSYEMAKRHVKQAGQVVLFNPDMRENPNVRNNFEKYLRFVTDAEGREFNALKNLVFFHYMGFNPVQILIEPTQQLISLVPYLVENGMPIGKAYSEMLKANKDIASAWANSKDGTLPNEIEDKAVKRAILKRTVDTGFVSDLYGETDLDFAVERTAFAGNDKLQDKLDLVRRPLYQLLAQARHLYGKTTPALNGKVAFLTAFRHEYARSGNVEKAEQFATQATDATMFGGGRAARPMVLQRFGSASGVGGLMYTLGSYTFNTIAMMGRLGRKAIKDSSLKPEEKLAAQKAFGLMLGTQLAFGGALGLPLVAAGMALLEQIFPGLDVRKNVREAFVNLAGDDEDMGHMVADGALRGLGNALTPVDFGSRFQLANLLGVSPYDGFSWANVAGPASQLLENYVKGVGQASQGQFGEAARTVAPQSIKQVLQLVHDDWAVRDKAGRMISEMTPAEQVLATIGFKPKRLTQYYEEQSIRERTEANQTRIIRDIRTDAATKLKDGDIQGARQVILQGTQEAGPYDPIGMAKEAAQLATEMQNPTLRRQGSRAMAEQEAEIARLYPQSKPISEVARVMQQAQLVRQMGMQFGKPSLEQLRVAHIVDNLMQANPKLTISQARVKAELMVSPAARKRSSISALLQAQ